MRMKVHFCVKQVGGMLVLFDGRKRVCKVAFRNGDDLVKALVQLRKEIPTIHQKKDELHSAIDVFERAARSPAS